MPKGHAAWETCGSSAGKQEGPGLSAGARLRELFNRVRGKGASFRGVEGTEGLEKEHRFWIVLNGAAQRRFFLPAGHRTALGPESGGPHPFYQPPSVSPVLGRSRGPFLEKESGSAPIPSLPPRRAPAQVLFPPHRLRLQKRSSRMRSCASSRAASSGCRALMASRPISFSSASRVRSCCTLPLASPSW